MKKSNFAAGSYKSYAGKEIYPGKKVYLGQSNKTFHYDNDGS